MSRMSSTDGRPRVGVVTVSYNSLEVLGEFLDSISAASASAVSVVVADNKPEPLYRSNRILRAGGVIFTARGKKR